ncbi:HDIG domain-containing protein [Saccharothrix mutabilis subsp. mutabilis]|uniref:HDIG domain-containing protein n=1 Tax=Saccharothrix mutabilis subsp. mutabilis TaxID=66855 RepID=A0ABP3CWP7_9PSEU
MQGVAARASQAAKLLPPPEGKLLIAAALLHDIGYAPGVRLTGFHSLDGARYLRTVGVPERLCALVAHHSCARIEAELRCLSVELAEWDDEATELRDALWWADMTTTPDGQPTNIHDRVTEIQQRYGPDDLVTMFIQRAEPELVAAVERTQARMRAAGVSHLEK